MKRVFDLRQLEVGNIVLVVGYDHMNFASNDPGGWFAETTFVKSLGSKEFIPRTLVVELMPLDKKHRQVCKEREVPWCITQGQEHASMPAAMFGGQNEEVSFIHNQGMAGDSEVKLFLLQTHGMEEDLEDSDDPRWGEVEESRVIPLKWTVEDLPLESWAEAA